MTARSRQQLVVYMDRAVWDWELDSAADGTRVFLSLEDLAEAYRERGITCERGVVEARIEFGRVIPWADVKGPSA